MHVIVWEFRVKSGHEGEFERIYGPGGDWARLFGRADGFLGIELLRESSGEGGISSSTAGARRPPSRPSGTSCSPSTSPSTAGARSSSTTRNRSGPSLARPDEE